MRKEETEAGILNSPLHKEHAWIKRRYLSHLMSDWNSEQKKMYEVTEGFNMTHVWGNSVQVKAENSMASSNCQQ